ncbi:hypothetical protein ACI797_21085 [Geodermatophilus sp. SYSU D00691]
MAAPARPVPGARLAIEVAAHFLPTPADRRRYQAEFAAELYGLPPAAQFRHAAGVLSHTPALRAALRAGRLPAAAGRQPLGRRFRCRVLRWHHWKKYSAPDGGPYLACSVCGKHHDGPAHWLAGAGMSGGGGLGLGGGGVA